MMLRERFDRWFRAADHARREIDAEIEAHLQARIDYLTARGMSPDEARLEAERRFGDVRSAREALVAQADARRRRLELGERFGRLGQDVRFAARGLRASRAFTLGVVATFALGLGVNAAVFRITDQVLFRPPAGVTAAEDVRRVEAGVRIGSAAPMRATTFSFADARRILEGGAFAAGSAYTVPRLLKDDEGREISVSYVDAGFFPLLGVRPFSGRAFTAAEGAPGSAHRVAVASHAYAQRAFGGRPLDGQAAVTIAGTAYRLIGVTSRGFTGIDLNPADVWIPLGDAELGQGMINGVVIPWHRTEMARPLRVVGRVRAGELEDVIRQKLDAAFAAAEGTSGAVRRTASIHPIVPAGDATRAQELTRLLLRLSIVAGVVLLIASANAVNLLLARGIRRGREFAVRIALGASRVRVMRLLVIESLLLAAMGAGAAVLSAHWTADALRRLVLPESRWTAAAFDVRTLWFTAAAALAAGLAAGLVPAIQATGQRIVGAIKEGRSPGARGGRTRAGLIVAQTSLSLALLIGCGLLVSSLVRLNAVDLGFDPSGVVTVAKGRSTLDGPKVDELAERLRLLSGVKTVSLASIVPFGATNIKDITVVGAPDAAEQDRELPMFNAVDHEYFAAMGMRMLRGRGIVGSDGPGAEPVAVVNAAMARRYWGSGDPFNSCIIASPDPCARVVGVVTDIRDTPGNAAAPMRLYVSRAQSAAGSIVAGVSTGALVIRADPEAVPALVAAVRSFVPGEQPPTIDIASERVAAALRPWSTATALFLALGGVALALASVGIYSVMNYLISERLFEMGIRLALGATAGGIVRLVLGRGVRLVLAGCLLGLAAAMALGRVIESLLFQVSTFEPLIYGLATASFIGLAVGAILPVAWRAARVNPVETLRSE